MAEWEKEIAELKTDVKYIREDVNIMQKPGELAMLANKNTMFVNQACATNHSKFASFEKCAKCTTRK